MGIYDPLSKAEQERQDKADRELEELEARRKAHYESEAEKDRLIPMRLAVKQFRIVESIRNYKEPDRFDVVIHDKETDKAIIKTVTREEFNKIQAKERGLKETHDKDELEVDKDQAENPESYETYITMCESGEWQSHNYDDLHYVPPGFGMRSRICGKWVPSGCIGAKKESVELETEHNKAQDSLHGVAGHGVANKKLLSCGKLSCPVCLRPTVKRRASAGTDRMVSYLLFLLSNVYKEHKDRIFNHIVISPKSELHTKLKEPKEIKKYEARIARRMKKIGLEGGAMVFHPFRFTKGLKRPYWSPHWHYVCTGYTSDADIKASYLKLNAVVRSLNTFSDTGRLFVLFRYLLTHAAQNRDPSRPNYHTIRYLGLANNRNFQTKRLMTKSSEFLDDLHDVLSDITSGDVVRTKKREDHKLKMQNVRMQIIKYDMSDIDKHLVYAEEVFTTYQEIHDYITKNIEHLNLMIDNVPTAKSDGPEGHDEPPRPKFGFSAVMRVTVSDSINDKCHEILHRVVLDFEQSNIGLCHICRRKKRRLVLNDLSNVDRLDIFDNISEPSDSVSIGLEDYHYFGREDLIGGQPYYDDNKDKIQYDDSILMRNPFFDRMSIQSKTLQCEAIRESVVRKLRRDAREVLDWPRAEEIEEFIRDRIDQYRPLFQTHGDGKLYKNSTLEVMV